MKLTRKLLSVLLSLMIIMSAVICMTTAVSASTGDIIYFEKPDSWSDTIYIYYWSASSGSVPSSMYDYSLTHVSGNIYSYTCKADFSEFLFNDGESGKHQTVDLKFPGSGYVCNVLSTGRTNNYGSYCNDASWSKYSPGLSVSASPESCDFMNSISVTLNCSEAVSSSYKLNGGESVEFQDGDTLTLGADAKVGDVVTLDLSATDGKETKTASYQYRKTSSPVASSIVYFDNSAYNWEDVYLYAYGTKENAEWPGEKMQKDENGMYYYTFSSSYSSENIIVNNGKEGDEKQQYPENSGLPINKGECKLLTADNQWVDYGTPDGKPAGFAYTADKTSFTGGAMNVKIGLKNAVKGTYQIDGGTVFEYTDTTTISVGQGAIGNKDITLTLTATSDSGEVTSHDYVYKKSFTPSKTTFSSPSDGHKTEALSDKYGTNPNMQFGKNKTITVDGNPSDWDSSMIIAQGVANDDPRVYMPSAMHEQPWDDYALYAAWDNDNLYFMWEIANTTYVVSPSDNFAASKESRPWRNSIPMYLALSINPEIHADGTAWGTNAKTGEEFTNPFVWGCDGGVAKDGGINFTTNVDTLIAFDTNNSNGGASIFKADKYDAENDNYMFDYDTAVPIGVTSFEKQDNRNGFKIAHDYGTLSDTLIGVGGAKGSHKVGDSLLPTSNWVDFYDLGYKKDHGFIYEVAIPFSTLGITKDYIENNGIGAMQILTYGTSGMDCLPYDSTMQDNADVEYSYDPSTSHEKEDVDNISVPLARVGALLSDTVINEAPFEVNFGSDKAGAQGVGTTLNLKAEPYNGKADYNYSFTVNGAEVQNSASDTYSWTPNTKGIYKLGVTVTDGSGKVAKSETEITIGDEPVIVTNPSTSQTTPTSSSTAESESTSILPSSSETTSILPSSSESTSTLPSSSESNPTQPISTDPVESSSSSDSTATIPSATTQSDSTGDSEPTAPTSESISKTDPTEQPATSGKDTNKISLNKTSIKLKAGKTYTLKVKGTSAKPKYTLKKKNIVSVSSKGKITALKKGETKITVKVAGKTLSCKVKVTSNPTAKINKKPVKSKKIYTVKHGRSITVKIAGKAEKINNVYKSSKKKTAKVTSKKSAKKIKIKGYKKGTAVINIKVNKVKTFKIKVKVK